MTGFEFGDIVLVPFPFTDQSSNEKCPALQLLDAFIERGKLKKKATTG